MGELRCGRILVCGRHGVGSCGVSELQCVGVLVSGSCGVWKLRGTNTNYKKDASFNIYKFKTTLHLNGVGALKCGCIAV